MKKLSVLAGGVVAVVFSMTAAAEGFSGPYVGIFGGKAYTTDEGKEVSPLGGFSPWAQETNPEQLQYGLLAGYNFDIGNNFVLGLEADYEGRDNNDDKAYQTFNGVPFPQYESTTRIKAGASFRGRAGYVFNNPYFMKSPIMLYVTGGYATVEVEREYLNLINASINTASTDWQEGWTAGAGAEYLINANFAARLEYRHSDYGSDNIHDYPWAATIEQSLTENSVRLGVSYQF